MYLNKTVDEKLELLRFSLNIFTCAGCPRCKEVLICWETRVHTGGGTSHCIYAMNTLLSTFNNRPIKKY